MAEPEMTFEEAMRKLEDACLADGIVGQENDIVAAIRMDEQDRFRERVREILSNHLMRDGSVDVNGVMADLEPRGWNDDPTRVQLFTEDGTPRVWDEVLAELAAKQQVNDV